MAATALALGVCFLFVCGGVMLLVLSIETLDDMFKFSERWKKK